MKYIFFILFSTAFWACNITDKKETPADKTKREQRDAAAMSDTANYTTIEWLDSTVQNLGEMKEGQIAEISWKFKNSGTYPLIIENVKAGCGCTVASAPKEPIAPGQQEVISAKFDSHDKPGHQDKNLTMYANIKNHNNGTDTQLRFVADVKE